MENWEAEKKNDVQRVWLCLHSNLVFMENGFLEREHHRAHGGITFRVRKASYRDNLFRGICTGASPVFLLETRSSHSRPFVILPVSSVSKEFIVILFL